MRKRKSKTTATQEERVTSRLYHAVGAYVKMRGGYVAVIGPIEIRTLVGEEDSHKFHVAVYCVGTLPQRAASGKPARLIHCSRCGEVGHSKRTCRAGGEK